MMGGAIYAFCDRTGVIEFGDHVPEGRLGIVRGSPRRVRDLISATARHAYDRVTLLVPGIPEAESDNDAVDALSRFCDWLAQRHPRRVRAAR